MISNLKYSNFSKKRDFRILKETKLLHQKRKDLSKIQIIEFSILSIILNYLELATKRLEDLSEIEFLSDKNESLKNDIIFSLTEGNDRESVSSNINLKYDKIIKELEKELSDRREQKKSYVTKLTRLYEDLDHLRRDYNFSFSITKLKSKDYYNGTISRKGHKSKSFTLGSPKLIEDRLRKNYKRRKEKIDYLDNVGWKSFLHFEFNDNSSKVKRYILGCINQDVTLKKFLFNRKILFPIKSDNK